MDYNKEDCIYDILSLYKNNLPFVVCEYFCIIYSAKILCKVPIKYKTLFEPFKEYKDSVKYEFQTILTNDKKYDYVRLKSMTILIKSNQEEEFVYRFSNHIHASSSESSIEWSDKDETPNGYVGQCTISF
jgi:hypothetical protein